MQDAGRCVPMLTTKCSANRGMGQIPTSSFGLLPNSTPVNSSKKLQRSNSLQNAVTPFPQALDPTTQDGAPERFESMLSNKPLTYGLGNCLGWG